MAGLITAESDIFLSVHHLVSPCASLRPFAWVWISRYLGQEVRPGLSSFVLVAQWMRHDERSCDEKSPLSEFGGFTMLQTLAASSSAGIAQIIINIINMYSPSLSSFFHSLKVFKTLTERHASRSSCWSVTKYIIGCFFGIQASQGLSSAQISRPVPSWWRCCWVSRTVGAARRPFLHRDEGEQSGKTALKSFKVRDTHTI